MSRGRMLVGALLLVGLAAVVLAVVARDGGSADSSESMTTIPQPTHAQLGASGLAELPLAPETERVDVAAPTFSDPTNVTNPLFPISELHSAVLSGIVEGKPFHTETTLLPDTRIIEWAPGQVAETLVSQYVAYLDGRIEEVALDYYAQADDGSVWYFGEDVYNYSEDGTIADTDGTWLAGKEGPPAMIMPADPQIGDVHRPENIPGLVFEEVTVKTVDATVDGPTGPVEGAIVGEELHQDGSHSGKTFAPGYGEFFSAHEGDVEAMALAVPTDALGGAVPAELDALSTDADEVFDAIQSNDWRAAAARVEPLNTTWQAYRSGQVPPRIAAEMGRALGGLGSGGRRPRRWRRGDGGDRRRPVGTRSPAPSPAACRGRPRALRTLGASARRGRESRGRGRRSRRSCDRRVDPGPIREHARRGRPHACGRSAGWAPDRGERRGSPRRGRASRASARDPRCDR